MAEYIEREEALEALLYEICGTGYQTTAMMAVRRIPAADVAPVVHGRWITWEDAGNFPPSPERYECSVCHDAAQRLCNGDDLLSFYCPNCGAKMDKEAHDGLDTP